MNIFFIYLKDYFESISLKKFFLTTLFAGVLVFINYSIGIERPIKDIHNWWLELILFYAFYFFVFSIAYLIQFAGKKTPNPKCRNKINEEKIFRALLLIAPLLFAMKMIYWDILFTGGYYHNIWQKYWSIILQLPVKLLVLLIALKLIWEKYKYKNSFYGFTAKQFNPLPYLLLIVCISPLIAFASTRPDFLHTYPKLKQIDFIKPYSNHFWLYQLFYEISYGLDFVAIEFFFRGFLVIGFIRFAGIKAILPMAAFYCTIHFGKPLFECITSYFGGLALGVITYRTKSILGGLMVHLGIAHMMEIGGYAGALYFGQM